MMNFLEKYNQLKVSDIPGGLLVAEQNQNIILDDVEKLSQEAWNTLACLLRPSILVLGATDLTTKLKSMLIGSEETTYIFPMTGGYEVQSRLGLETIRQFQARAIRSNPQEYPIVELPQNLKNTIKSNPSMSIRIVDDVVSAGRTAQAVVESISQLVTDTCKEPVNDQWDRSAPYRKGLGYPYPAISIYTWLKRESSRLSPIYGFGRVINPKGAIGYKGKGGIPPLNSISTFLKNGTREQAIKKGYAEKYSNNSSAFIGLLNELSQG